MAVLLPASQFFKKILSTRQDRSRQKYLPFRCSLEGQTTPGWKITYVSAFGFCQFICEMNSYEAIGFFY